MTTCRQKQEHSDKDCECLEILMVTGTNLEHDLSSLSKQFQII